MIVRKFYRKEVSIETVRIFDSVFKRKQIVNEGIATIQWSNTNGKTISSKLYSLLEMNYLQYKFQELEQYKSANRVIIPEIALEGNNEGYTESLDYWDELQKDKKSNEVNDYEILNTRRI